jgi:hypothetical protein
MLNFIVLGYVPGTSVQLNFFQILLIISGLLTVLLVIAFFQMRLSRRKFQSTLGFCLRSLSRQLQRAQAAELAQ